MLIEDRRRAFLREVGQWLLETAIRIEVAAAKIETGNDLASSALRAHAHAEQALLLSMPNGAVEFRGGDPDAIPIQRNGITLIVPGDTPCEILDAMFEIAEELTDPQDGVELRFTTAEFLALVKESRRL